MRIADSVKQNLKMSSITPCFNRTQSRVGLFSGRNTLRRHLHVLGLNNSLLCKMCGADAKTSAHILCEREALASLRHTHLVSFYLDPEYVRSLSLGVIWNTSKGTGLRCPGIKLWGKKVPF